MLATVCPSAPQSQAGLQITSPTNNAIVNPGQTITIGVSPLNNNTFTQVFVTGDVGTTSIATSAPAQFSLTIPNKISLGKHTITAVGATASKQLLYSGPIDLDVERPDFPTRLIADPDRVLFGSSQGDTAPLGIQANFSDGTFYEASESSNITFASSNTRVATVNKHGVITSVGKGTATITATYTLGTQTISVSIPVTVPPPAITSTPTSLNFGNQNLGTTSTSQTLTITNVSSNQGMTIGPVSAFGDFSETDNCKTSSPIAVGATCTVNVAFTPTAVGARAGTVTVPDSMEIVAPTIPLSGTGIGGPSLTSLSPKSGAVGTSVTITGNNFGSPQGASTATFNGTSATPTSWSNTSIVVPVPAGATTGNVVVTVGGVQSNGLTFTVQGTTNGIILVQHASIDIATATSGSLSFAANNAAGNWIGVCVRAGRSNEVITITDTQGNSYHQAVQFNDTLDAPNGNTIAIFYAENISSGTNTITVSDTISATLRFAILEYTGVATANSFDVTAGAQGNSASANSGNATTTANGELLLGAIATADSARFSTPTGVEIRESVPAEPNTKLIAEEQIQAAAGTAAAVASLAASDPWGAILACFKPAHP